MLNAEKKITISLDEYNRLLESQKQVDELKERCEIAEGTKTRLTIFDRIKIHDKAVKDTAKEILITAIQLSDMCETFYEFQNRLIDLIEVDYGLEVERKTIIPANGVEVE